MSVTKGGKRSNNVNEDYLPSLAECIGLSSKIQKGFPFKRLSRSQSQVEPSNDAKASEALPTTTQEALIPIGTPVLALWGRVYYPALIVDHSFKTRKYRVKYCDDVNKWLSRKSISTTTDQDFMVVPIPKSEVLEGLFSHSQTQNNYSLQDLKKLIKDFTQNLRDIIVGKMKSRRREQFFTNQKTRSSLAHEVLRGPFTFSEFYQLSDTLLTKVGLIMKDQTLLSKFAEEAQINIEDTSLRILIQQFISIVLLPELIMWHLQKEYPNDSVEEKLISLCQNSQNDYVNFLLSKRDMVHWAYKRFRL